MQHAPLYILWDESHLWGVLLLRAIQAFSLPYRLVRAAQVAEGLLDTAPPAVFLVPGGSARAKAEALGVSGMAAIRRYVHSGGQYIGFCGGAGLALNFADGLGICPLERAAYEDRIQHFLSGHLHVTLPVCPHPLVPQGLPSTPLLPVWWPGRFACVQHSELVVLARYAAPSDDFWLADLPIGSLPEGIFDTWRDVYGFAASPDFLQGQPCLVQGRHGAGGYILSYSHLETPASPHANRWLAHLLQALAGLHPATTLVPEWGAHRVPVWDDPTLRQVDKLLFAIARVGIKHGLLIERNSWLLGWRFGIPGACINNLLAAIACLRSQPPTPAVEAFWRTAAPACLEQARIFHKGVIDYFLAERLHQTLAKPLPEFIPVELLKKQRTTLFGPPMHPSGLYQDLLHTLDTATFLLCEGPAAALL